MKGTNYLAQGPVIDERRWRKFLRNVVNASDQQIDRLTNNRTYADFFPVIKDMDSIRALLPLYGRRWSGSGNAPVPVEDTNALHRGVIAEMRDRLRGIWEAEDVHAAGWRLSNWQVQLLSAGQHAPIRQALYYLQRHLDRLRKCGYSGCEEPLFITPRDTQPFCSLSCAQRALKENSKRKKVLTQSGDIVQNSGPRNDGRESKRLRAHAGPATGLTDRIISEFLVGVVNAEDKYTDGSNQYFFLQYPMFFPMAECDIDAFYRTFCAGMGGEVDKVEVSQIYYRAVIGTLRIRLRGVWKAEDNSTAGWRMFILQSEMYKMMDITQDWHEKNLQPPPLHAPIHHALHWLRQNLSKLRKCRNALCVSPFFIADKTKTQYCSDSCRKAAKNESRRKWWKKGGPQWRDKMRKEQKGESSKK